MHTYSIFTVSFIILLVVSLGPVSAGAQDNAAEETIPAPNGQAPDNGASPPDSAELEETSSAPGAAAEPADEAPDPGEPEEPVQRTPMSAPSYAPFGESQRGMPAVTNPVFPSLSDRRFRFGTVLDFGFGYEVGDVDDDWVSDVGDVFDDFEDLEERASRFREQFEQGMQPDETELNEFLDDLRNFEGDANELVDVLAERAYAKLNLSGSFPLAPIAVRSDTLRGTFSLNADAFAEARGGIFTANNAFTFNLENVEANDVDRIEFDEDREREVIVLTDGTEREIEADDDAGIAVQGGAVGRVGAGYSTDVWEAGNGRLHAGTTFNFFHTTLVRTGVLFDEDNFGDAVEDAFDDSDKTSTGFGLDLGAAWVGERYLVGGVVRNINQPSFEYPDTSDSEFFENNPDARRNGDNWRMDRQFTLQGALFSADQRWMASAAVDLNSATDTTGDDYQWASVLGSFEPRRTWAPSPRVGARTNLTGEKLTYVNAGLTFFRALHIDVASTLDTIKADGNTVPRGAQVNIALGRRF